MAKSICVSRTSASLRLRGAAGVREPSQSQKALWIRWPCKTLFRQFRPDGISVVVDGPGSVPCERC